MTQTLTLVRRYWSEPRAKHSKETVAFHRDVTFLRPDGFGVEIHPYVNGHCRVFTVGGVMPRARKDFSSLREGLRYAVYVAKQPADLWGYSRKALKAEAALRAGWAQ